MSKREENSRVSVGFSLWVLIVLELCLYMCVTQDLATLTTSKKLVYIILRWLVAVAATYQSETLVQQIMGPTPFRFFLFGVSRCSNGNELELFQRTLHIAYCHFCHIIFMPVRR